MNRYEVISDEGTITIESDDGQWYKVEDVADLAKRVLIDMAFMRGLVIINLRKDRLESIDLCISELEQIIKEGA